MGCFAASIYLKFTTTKSISSVLFGCMFSVCLWLSDPGTSKDIFQYALKAITPQVNVIGYQASQLVLTCSVLWLCLCIPFYIKCQTMQHASCNSLFFFFLCRWKWIAMPSRLVRPAISLTKPPWTWATFWLCFSNSWASIIGQTCIPVQQLPYGPLQSIVWGHV